MRRLIVSLTVALAVVLPAVPAKAGGGAGAYTDDDTPSGSGASGGAYTDTEGAGSHAENVSTSPSTGRRGGSTRPCEYALLQGDDARAAESWWGFGGDPLPTGAGGWYRKICYDEQGRSSATIVWIPQRADPAAMAAEAQRYLPLPAPGISTSPAADDMLVVSFDTWLWVDRAAWQPMTSTVSVPGVSVTLTATPQRVVWDMGDGGQVVCNGPGTAYDPDIPDDQQSTDCSYVYRRSSAREPDERFKIVATTEWRVTWAVTGAPGGGDLGMVPRSTPPLPVRVGEVQAVNTSTNEGQ